MKKPAILDGFPSDAIMAELKLALTPKTLEQAVRTYVRSDLDAKTRAAPVRTIPNGDAFRVVKGHDARAGSKRAKQLDKLFSFTSLRAAKAAGVEQVDITYALKRGFISQSL